MIRLLLYVITAISLIVLRRRKDQPTPEFSVPGGLVVPVAAVALSVWLLSNSTLREARDVGIAAAIGLIVFGATKLAFRGSARIAI